MSGDEEERSGEEAVQELFRWARARGLRTLRDLVVAPTPSGGGRGVLTREPLAPGTRVLAVPAPLLLTTANARRADPALHAALAAASPQPPPAAALAIALLAERAKGASSAWAPYLATLPPAYDVLALWSPEEATQLQLPHAVAAAAAERDALWRQWRAAAPTLAALALPAELATVDAWGWAAAAISSRTVFLPDDAAGALCPVGDMFNFEPPPPAPDAEEGPDAADVEHDGDDGAAKAARGLAGDGALSADGSCYEFSVWRTYAAGNEVCLCYGALSGLQLLQHYGFTIDDNPHDTVPLDVGGGDAAQHCVRAGGAPSWEALAALRLAALPAAQRKRDGHSAASGRPLAPAFEAAAQGRLQRACEEALRALPTTAAADEEELRRRGGGSGRAELALRFRAAQKRLLAAAAARAAAAAAAAREAASAGNNVVVRGVR